MSKQRRWLLAIFALGLILRMAFLHDQSFFVDEVIDLDIAQKSISEVIHEPNSFPPVYHLLLKAWHGVWKYDLSIRWFSVFVGMLTIGCVYLFVKELTDSTTATWSAGLMAIAPMHIFYSQQARAYAFYIFLVAIACWLVARAIRTDRWSDWLAFALVNAIGNCTHYFFPILSITLFCVLLYKRGLAAFNRKTFAVIGVIIVASIPAALLIEGDFSYQTRIRESRPLSLAAAGYTLFSFFSGYSLGPSKTELQSMPTNLAIKQVLPFAIGVACFAIPLGIRGARRLHQSGALIPTLLILFLPMLIVGVAGFAAGVTYNVRFIAWSQIGLVVLLAAGCVQWKKKSVVIPIAFMIVMSGLAISNRWFVPRYQNEDVQTVIAQLPDRSGKILTCVGYMHWVVRYYAGTDWTVTRLMDVGYPEGTDEWAIRTITEAVEEAPRDEGVWLVYARAFHGDPNGTILRHLETNFQLDQPHVGSGVRLFRIRKKKSL